MANRMISEETIFEKVREAVVLALGVEEEQVTREASLIEDLGAESIDFLDIAFRLERVFDIRLARENVLEKATEIFGEEAIIQDGVLKGTALQMIRERMPEADPAKLQDGLCEEDIAPLFTIATWIRAVDEILQALPEQCPKCGSSEYSNAEDVKVACKSCGEKAAFPTGDALMEKWLGEMQQRTARSA